MKSTGIVRRIDDLGRVVIPKEVRRTMRLKEGDPLELFMEGEYVCFRRYSTEPELKGAIEGLHAVIYGEASPIEDLPEEQAASIKALLHVLERDLKEYIFDKESTNG